MALKVNWKALAADLWQGLDLYISPVSGKLIPNAADLMLADRQEENTAHFPMSKRALQKAVEFDCAEWLGWRKVYLATLNKDPRYFPQWLLRGDYLLHTVRAGKVILRRKRVVASLLQRNPDFETERCNVKARYYARVVSVAQQS